MSAASGFHYLQPSSPSMVGDVVLELLPGATGDKHYNVVGTGLQVGKGAFAAWWQMECVQCGPGAALGAAVPAFLTALLSAFALFCHSGNRMGLQFLVKPFVPLLKRTVKYHEKDRQLRPSKAPVKTAACPYKS